MNRFTKSSKTRDSSYTYEQVASEIERQRSRSRSWLQNLAMLFISFLIFFKLGLLKAELRDLVLITVVLLVHEVGHFTSMHAFRYRNVQVLFIPFFGAAVSGESRNTSAFKKAIVTLMGPLPGIFIGIPLLIAHLKTHTPIYCQLARMFFLVNGFNLLPFLPLDGGRFLQQTLFSGKRYIELFLQLLMALGLLAGACILGSWLFALLGLINLISSARTFKTEQIAGRLRQCFCVDPTGYTDEIPQGVGTEIVDSIYKAFSAPLTLASVARFTEQVWKRMHLAPLGVRQTLGFLPVYILCLGLSLFSLAGAAVISLSDDNTIIKRRIAECEEPSGELVWREQFYVFGKLTTQTDLTSDKLLYHGKAVKYYFDGTVWREGSWYNGKKHGEWKYYDEQGNLIRVRVFDKGNLLVCREREGDRWIEKRLGDLPTSE